MFSKVDGNRQCWEGGLYLETTTDGIALRGRQLMRRDEVCHTTGAQSGCTG